MTLFPVNLCTVVCFLCISAAGARFLYGCLCTVFPPERAPDWLSFVLGPLPPNKRAEPWPPPPPHVPAIAAPQFHVGMGPAENEPLPPPDIDWSLIVREDEQTTRRWPAVGKD